MQRELEDKQKRAPKGKIHVVNTKRRIQFYLRTDPSDKSGCYLPKRAGRKIRTYLQKAYDEKILKLIRKEKKNLERFLKSAGDIQERIRRIYSNYPDEIKEYIEPIDLDDDDFAAEWMKIPFSAKLIYEPAGNFITEKGEQVRSKSELLIANALFRNGVPYKYECPLRMPDGATVHPDFTILNKRERKIMYWEHRGLMDEREYARHTVAKIREYGKAGIYLGDQLIISEETSVSPLDTAEVETLIAFYCKK